jgi:hypothetical protein
LTDETAAFSMWWINPKTGHASAAGEISGGAVRKFDSPPGEQRVLWLSRK